MLIKCKECGIEYRGNKNGNYCSTKCMQRNTPSQYQKMKGQLKALSIKNSDLALKNERLERELEDARSLNRIMALKLQEDKVPF